MILVVYICLGDSKCIESEGMPHYKNVSEFGDLYVTFEVVFPPNNWVDHSKLKTLEGILPNRTRVEIPTGMEVDDVELTTV